MEAGLDVEYASNFIDFGWARSKAATRSWGRSCRTVDGDTIEIKFGWGNGHQALFRVNGGVL